MERNVLLFASFFHDIGKFKQRGKGTRDIMAHPKEGKETVEILINLTYKERIEKLIEQHHGQNYKEEDPLIYIIQLSDWLSSSERELNEEESDYKTLEQISSTYSMLINPLSRKELDESKEQEEKEENVTYFDITTIDEATITTYNKENFQKYKELWEKFEQEARTIQTLIDEKKIFEFIFYLSKKYTWAIPSATLASGRIPSISLFDHSQTVAAYSLAFYETGWKKEEIIRLLKDLRENFQKNKEGKKGIKIEELKEKELLQRKPFLFVAGDISGIQNYVYWTGKGSKSQHRAKQLRGRSFLLRLIEDSVIYKIKEELDLAPVSILQKGGGRILLLVPNTPEKRDKLEKTRDQLQKLLFLQYSGKIKLNLALVEVSVEDILKGYGNTITKKIEESLMKAKNIGAKTIFLDQKLQEELKKRGYEKVKCEQCEQPLEKEYKIIKKVIEKGKEKEEEIKCCINCKNEYEIGDKIAKIKNYYFRIIDADSNLNVDNLICPINGSGIYYYFPVEEKEKKKILENIGKNAKISIIQVNKTLPLQRILSTENLISEQIKQVDIELIGNYWKKGRPIESEENQKYIQEDIDEEKMVRFTFDDMAKSNKQLYLGWAKIDGDNLGTYFEKIEKLSEYCFSSRALEIFFCKIVNEILEEYQPGEFSKKSSRIKEQKGYPGYIVFSGGDDLFLVGSWIHTIEVINNIAKEYAKYTANKRTFSAGFALTSLAFPIQLANSIVDREEKNAKGPKNSIGLFDVVVSLTDKAQQERQTTLEEIIEDVLSIERNLPSEKGEQEETKKTTLIRNLYDILEDGIEKERANKMLYKDYYLPFFYNTLIRNYDLKNNRENELEKFDRVCGILLTLAKKDLKLAQLPLILYLLKNRERKEKRGE